MVPAIQVENVSKHYGTLQALDAVSLTVERGEFFGLLGPNGAGKTTLISILAGLALPSGGTARVMGHDVVSQYRAARRALGVVPQELVFDPFFTVREALTFQSGYFGLRNNHEWIGEVMHHLDLDGKAETNMRLLSGGMKRRGPVGPAPVAQAPAMLVAGAAGAAGLAAPGGRLPAGPGRLHRGRARDRRAARGRDRDP